MSHRKVFRYMAVPISFWQRLCLVPCNRLEAYLEDILTQAKDAKLAIAIKAKEPCKRKDDANNGTSSCGVISLLVHGVGKKF
ncbi:hypothetical protein ACH5RR_015388 [Cinchona calisaya]|uniref:Uncharacterized protein n=1 Tax=Cinchona calisaya TaxID=153742 RepID=A0ABD2ZT33_9GENT